MKRLPTWLEIDLDRLDRNIETIQNAIGADVGILLTVKADAYGHGAVQVVSAVAPRVRIFGVATVDEAVELWESGIRNDILILSPILETELPAVVRHGFAITLSSAEFADAVIVGSAVVKRMEEMAAKPDKILTEVPAFIARLREAMDQTTRTPTSATGARR